MEGLDIVESNNIETALDN